MKVLYGWLKEFLPELSASPHEVAERLTMAGLEASDVWPLNNGVRGVLIGEVKSIENHPNSATLKVAVVSAGDGREYKVVVGAPNLKVGSKYPFAPPGATVAGSRAVEKRTIRGIPSEGMLLSGEDLGIEPKSAGLLELDDDAPTGADFVEYWGLNDYVIEVDVTANRGDALSHLGVARELSAIYGLRIVLPKIAPPEVQDPVENFTSVEILNLDACPKYTARIILDVRVGKCPDWMAKKLFACGMRPINNIVDITNYVMLELGEPLHAFDFEKLAERKIIVRNAKDGEKILALDGKEYMLSANDLVIADAEKAVAIAGVIGGEETGVVPSTKNILLEAAFFNPVPIRRTARSLGIATESSQRFSRGVDWEGVEKGSNRAAYLMAKIAKGKVAKGIIVAGRKARDKKRITVHIERMERFVGQKIPKEVAIPILEKLGFKVEDRGETWEIVVPSWRTEDVQDMPDIVEEIVRIWGTDKVKSTLPRKALSPSLNRGYEFQEKVKKIFAGFGFTEILTFSFLSSELYRDFGFERYVKLLNPIAETLDALRPSILPGLVVAAQRNVAHQERNFAIFEVGMVFEPAEGGAPKERPSLGILVSGNVKENPWYSPRSLDCENLFAVKGAIENLFDTLGIKDVAFERVERKFLHPGRGFVVKLGETELGIGGELHPNLIEKYELVERTAVAELYLDKLMELAKEVPKYEPIPRFPAFVRDLAFVMPEDIPFVHIKETIRNEAKELLDRIEVFDVYRGPQIPEGTKSVAVRIHLRARDRTLTAEEGEEVISRIVDSLRKDGIKLRVEV